MKRTSLTILLAFFLLFLVSCKSENKITGESVLDDSYVRIPLSDLSDTARFYTFDDGVEVRYFAVLGSDGEPRTAFDACDVCGGYRGYEQRGTDIVCRNCGKVFRIDGLGTKNQGYGCWPSYLPHEIRGNELLIKEKDIKANAYMFS